MNLPELPKGLYFKAGPKEGRERRFSQTNSVPGISLRKKPFGQVLYRSTKVDFLYDADVERSAQELLNRYKDAQAKFSKTADVQAEVNKHGKASRSGS